MTKLIITFQNFVNAPKNQTPVIKNVAGHFTHRAIAVSEWTL